MLDWRSERGKIEAEANTFASFLLMPLDDFRAQVQSASITIDLMRHLSNRYEVSVTAAILKWLSITDKRAMIVIGKEGFIDWAWSSEPLIRSGVYYRARQEVVPLPPESLAAIQDLLADNEAGTRHPVGVWLGDESVYEMTVFSPVNEMSISLLIYPNDAPSRRWGHDLGEPRDWDTFDQFTVG